VPPDRFVAEVAETELHTNAEPFHPRYSPGAEGAEIKLVVEDAVL
jgi:hypothetical protein